MRVLGSESAHGFTSKDENLNTVRGGLSCGSRRT